MPDCSICLAPLTNGSTVQTPCDHYFHKVCLSTWLETNPAKTCPNCRGALDLLVVSNNVVRDNVRATIASYRTINIPGRGLGGALLDEDCP